MVISALVNFILMMFYALLAYITFKELSNKRASEETHQRILLKWITSAVFFSGFWIIEYMFYFLPTSFFKLPIGLWILMPQFYGEYTLYNMFSEFFEKLEYSFRNVRNTIASTIFGSTFLFSVQCFETIKKFIPNSRLQEFQNEVRTLYQEVNKEIKLRKDMSDSKSMRGMKSPHPKSSEELRDSTVNHVGERKKKPPMYFKPPTSQIYTPVGLFTTHSQSVLETGSANLNEEVAEVDELRKSTTSVKKGKHSRKDSKKSRTSIKKSIQEVGRGSSYIDPNLAKKMNSTDFEFIEKEDYSNSKKNN